MNKRKRQLPSYQFKLENLPFDIFNKVLFYINFYDIAYLMRIKSLYPYLINHINFYQFYVNHFIDLCHHGLFIDNLYQFYHNQFNSKFIYQKGKLENDTLRYNKLAFNLCQISQFNISFNNKFAIKMFEYNFKDQYNHEKSGLFDFQDFSFDLKLINDGIYNHSFIIIYNTITFEISKIQSIRKNLHLRFNNQTMNRSEKLICVASEDLTNYFIHYKEDKVKKIIKNLFVERSYFINVKTFIIPAFNKEILKIKNLL